MQRARSDRLESLDLIRGVAVLGILAINIAGFAGPSIATLSPHLPAPGSLADKYAFAINFVVFEGKMRALFSLLFGASLALFIERADAAGKFGALLQMRRLVWLGLFGLAHFYLLWWGDILFLYAVAGVLALFLYEMDTRRLVTTALTIFALWHLGGAAMSWPGVAAEDRVRTGTALLSEKAEYAQYRQYLRENAHRESEALSGSFTQQASSRIDGKTLQPFMSAFTTMGETLPLMLLGIALMRSGFFSGSWPRKWMRAAALAGTGTGLALTCAILAWAWQRDFPPRAMEAVLLYWAAAPHLLMAIGYAAILVLATPTIAHTPPGRWLTNAGRMAFSNYIGTSILMTWMFYGWGLGWIGRFGPAWQWPFVLLGWTAMIVWSAVWLSRFRRGPLEWAWRSLVELRLLSNR